MLRNENIPVVHQEHAYDDADVALTMALPWVHELGWPLTTVRLLLALELAITWLCLRRLLSTPLRSHFFAFGTGPKDVIATVVAASLETTMG